MTKKENALRSQQEERCHAEHSFGHSEHFFSVIPNTSSLSFPNAVRNPVWMLHYASASLSMTKRRMRFAQHDKTEDVMTSDSFVTSDSKLCIAEIERVMQRLIFL